MKPATSENVKLRRFGSFDILPVPKPRMTQRDKWKQRDCVLRYYAFKDAVRLHNVSLPNEYRVTFYMPMPKSWSNKKKLELSGKPHTQKPDKDNLEKALLDSIYGEDSHIWSGWARKIWAEEASIFIEEIIQ